MHFCVLVSFNKDGFASVPQPGDIFRCPRCAQVSALLASSVQASQMLNTLQCTHSNEERFAPNVNTSEEEKPFSFR